MKHGDTETPRKTRKGKGFDQFARSYFISSVRTNASQATRLNFASSLFAWYFFGWPEDEYALSIRFVEFDRVTKITRPACWADAKFMRCAVSAWQSRRERVRAAGAESGGENHARQDPALDLPRTQRFGQTPGRPGEVRCTLAPIGYLHESQAFRYLTATGLLEYYGALTGVSAAICGANSAAARPRRPGHRTSERFRFSKGMVQRLALAQAWSTSRLLCSTSRPKAWTVARATVARSDSPPKSRAGRNPRFAQPGRRRTTLRPRAVLARANGFSGTLGEWPATNRPGIWKKRSNAYAGAAP